LEKPTSLDDIREKAAKGQPLPLGGPDEDPEQGLGWTRKIEKGRLGW